MSNILVDYSSTLIRNDELEVFKEFVKLSHKMLHEKTGKGNDFLGWVDYPISYSREEFKRVRKTSEYIRENCDALVVIGIGGSYLGAKAVIEVLSHSFHNILDKGKRKSPEIYFAGNNISGKYLKDLFEVLEGKDICVNVISKSGTTTEPAIAFRFFKKYMEEKYGKEEAKKRIFATTDKEKGALKKLADIEGYEKFTISDDIGGRYSVFTAVGLLPVACAGIDVEELLRGALDGYKEYSNEDLNSNQCYKYAVLRNILYNKGKNIEIFVNYEPSLHFVSEWLKQLFGESEGKDGKGIFPASVDFSSDLHSMGQYIQDGSKILFETVLNICQEKKDMTILSTEENLDGLNYLADKTVNYVNNNAFKGTLLAHVEGNVPNIVINIPEMTPYYLGKLLYFFEKACGISGYLLGVNPFNQPGVEAYKKNMFALLGKKGYEDLRLKLIK